MWECYNCAFQNVDAAPVCAKCRAPKPDPNQPRQGRSFYAAQMASQEKVAAEVMGMTLPPPPTQLQLSTKWDEAAASPPMLSKELASLERREYALREAIRLLLQVVKNPQARGNDVQLNNVLASLRDWDLGS